MIYFLLKIFQAAGRFRCEEGFTNDRLEKIVTKSVPGYMNFTYTDSVPIEAYFRKDYLSGAKLYNLNKDPFELNNLLDDSEKAFGNALDANGSEPKWR